MADEQRPTIHTMPIDTLRARSREAQRMVDQARELVRASFEENAPDSGREKQVGAMLDAIERLLPGIGLLAVRQAGERGGKSDSGALVPTPREKTREQIERAELIASITESVAVVLQDIERGRASVRSIEVPPVLMLPVSFSWTKRPSSGTLSSVNSCLARTSRVCVSI